MSGRLERRQLLQVGAAATLVPLVALAQSTASRSSESYSLQFFDTNGIRVRAAVEGDGPLVIMVHGFPELWYSWRHQIRAVAAAGYRVVAPDVRGYGGSDKPQAIDSYDMREMTADVVGLIDALGEDSAILVGHDWGAPIVWNTAFLHPDRISAVAGLSVPARPRGETSTLDLWRTLYEGRFFYQLYFLEEGVAEAELEADMHATFRKLFLYGSGDIDPAVRAALSDKPLGSGWLDGMPDPDVLPDWITAADIDYFAANFSAGGFRGPLNRYRAQQRDWELLPELSNLRIAQPSCFIAGSRDGVRNFIPGVDMFETAGEYCADFRGATIVDGVGHWVQQEAPDEVNRALLAFLAQL